MSLTKHMSDDGKLFTLKIRGKFDFNLVQAFRAAYAEVGDNNPNVVVDLRETDYMDSSALGMLLNMQKTIKGRVDNISIVNCKPQIKKILQISRFDKKFDIE
ncbi:STAS domain-containing protein [Flocculibacter collagenilyticus]|uniref:STAS domain-containing protein n=1 Tax=Flocculibacter collagenilyticus TaxID=2744479 RepID=UPI0018F7BBA1|nr:STAS domain-containing protein [Flocculibacter collagenilyticus]